MNYFFPGIDSNKNEMIDAPEYALGCAVPELGFGRNQGFLRPLTDDQALWPGSSRLLLRVATKQLWFSHPLHPAEKTNL